MTKKILIGLGLGLISLIIYWALPVRLGSERWTFTSPDKKYKVVVYYSPNPPMTFPGQAGDAPGIVCLYEVKTGKRLKTKKVEMVQNIDDITWTPTNVSIKFFADWKLPK